MGAVASTPLQGTGTQEQAWLRCQWLWQHPAIRRPHCWLAMSGWWWSHLIPTTRSLAAAACLATPRARACRSASSR